MRFLSYMVLVLVLCCTALGVHRLLTPAAAPATISDADPSSARFVCPMHPSIHAQSAGICPICGMPLSPIGTSSKGLVYIDDKRRQTIGVCTQAVERGARTLMIRAPALITYDETRRTTIAPRFGGWVKSVYGNVPGSTVHAGDALFSIYSPELVAAQTDYLSAWSARSGAGADIGIADSLIALSRTKLMRLGMPEDQLAAFEQHPQLIDQLIIRAPADGTIIERTVVPGARIESGGVAMQLADLSTVWLEASVYAQDLTLLAPGQLLSVRAGDDPSLVLEAPITTVLPEFDPATRSGHIRAQLPNPQGRLRIGMLMECTVSVPLGQVLTVPDGAVIYAGEKRIAFVAIGGGHYRPTRVTVGRRGDDWIEVTEGLQAGDQVVSKGVFLLASESRLASGLEQW